MIRLSLNGPYYSTAWPHGEPSSEFETISPPIDIAALATPPAPATAGLRALVEALKNRVDTRLNNHLVDMREGWDDSVSGFNDAWDIVRKVFAEELERALKEDGHG